jgi:H+/gluconate symporter-like permease
LISFHAIVRTSILPSVPSLLSPIISLFLFTVTNPISPTPPVAALLLALCKSSELSISYATCAPALQFSLMFPVFVSRFCHPKPSTTANTSSVMRIQTLDKKYPPSKSSLLLSPLSFPHLEQRFTDILLGDTTLLIFCHPSKQSFADETMTPTCAANPIRCRFFATSRPIY